MRTEEEKEKRNTKPNTERARTERPADTDSSSSKHYSQQSNQKREYMQQRVLV